MSAETTRYTDQYGRTPDAFSLSHEIATPEVVGARNVVGAAIASGLTPYGLTAVIQQATYGDIRAYLTLAEEMEERYHHYASQLQTRRLAIEGIEPTVEHDKAVPKKIVDAVNELVEGSDFDEMTGTLTDAIGKGYSVSEIMWEYRDGLLKPARYIWRDPRFFQFDHATQTELRLADLSAPLDGLPLPAAKFIRHVPRMRMGLPIRRGMARAAAWAFLIQKFTLADWAAFAEVYGMPLRIGRYGPNASADDKAALLRAVRQIASDAAAIAPAGMEFEFAAVEGQHGAAVFGGLIEYVDKGVSKLVLGQTMTSDDGSSMAQANVHNDVRLDILKADGKQLAQTVNRDLIVPFVVMNFGEQDVYPRAAYRVAEPEDISGLTSAVERLVPFGLRVSQREMRERVGLSEPEDGEELLTAPAAAPAPTAPTDPAALAARAARLAATTTAPDAIEAATSQILADEGWEELVRPMVAGLADQLTGASSEEEAIEMLAAYFGQMNADELAETLARATFAARLAGEAGDDLGDRSTS